MKSKRKVVRFDYSKYESKSTWNHNFLTKYEFWGFHPKSGRLHIDTKRYKKVCESLGITYFLPTDLFSQRSTTYYKPSKVNRYDYKFNIFKDCLGELKEDWFNEYKPLLNKIITPEEIEERQRVSALSYTSTSDDFDEICLDAKMKSFKRMPKYNHFIKSLYCQFIQKIVIEVDRHTMILMTGCGWNEAKFDTNKFKSFSSKLLNKKRKVKISKLPEYETYDLLHKLNNFLKHNSLDSYNNIEKNYSNHVASVNNGKAKKPYENGMYACDWIIVEFDYIDKLFDKLTTFFENYCRVYFKENIERSNWDYDGYFYEAIKQMRYPEKYLGLVDF